MMQVLKKLVVIYLNNNNNNELILSACVTNFYSKIQLNNINYDYVNVPDVSNIQKKTRAFHLER